MGPSPPSVAGDLPARLGLEAWRVGFLVAPPALCVDLIELKQGLSICTAAVAQHAAVAALQECGVESPIARPAYEIPPARVAWRRGDTVAL